MSARDWATAEYARIYASVVDDEKFADVYDDDQRWAAYTRLLLAAELAYPAPAALPRWIADDVLAHLVAVRIVELVRGSFYRIVGLDSERRGRATGRAAGGVARASDAERGPGGRFLPASPASNAPATASNVQHPASNGSPAPDQQASLDRAETEEEQEDERDTPPTPPPSRGGGSRADGTNRRALRAASDEEARQAVVARDWRAQQRDLAYRRGALREAQLAEMNHRDAPLDEIPGYREHVDRIRAEALL